MKYSRYIFVLFLPVFFFSCKTTKQITGLSQPTGKQIIQPEIRTANFNNIAVKLNMGGASFSSRASMKIIKDSIIQLSIMPVLGIEAARIDITPKSVLVVNKIQSLYYQTNYDSLLINNNIPFRYKDVEAILLNRLFVVGNPSTATDELLPLFKMTEMADGAMLQNTPVVTKDGAFAEFKLDAQRRIEYCSILYSQLTLRSNYSNFTQQGDVVFPFKYKLQLQYGAQADQCEVQINNAEFNKTIKINTTNLSHYKRVDSIDQIYKN
jgi:hypothetical protein